jgi:dihydroorotase
LAKSVQLLKEAKAEGLNVSCEVTPHHLYFTFEEIPENNTSFKMNPPLRDVQDRIAMQHSLRSGDIGFVATDHAPHSEHDKGHDFVKAAFGTTGMETSLLVLLELLRMGKIDEKRLVEVFSTAPAEYLGIGNRFGTLDKGKDFNAILFDRNYGPHKISDEDLASLSHNNVFLGVDLPGKVLNFFNTSYQFNLI